jgi:MFS family permease
MARAAGDGAGTSDHDLEPSRPAGADWKRRIVLALLVAGVVIVLTLTGEAFLPRWWAQRVGDQVQGSIVTGILVGLFYGFVFTLLPLALVWFAFEVFDSWRTRGIALALAVLLAAPNLLTLGIVLGRGNGPHAGDRVLDVEAPAFRGACLVGALLAVLALAVAWYLLASRRRARRRLEATRSTPEPQA